MTDAFPPLDALQRHAKALWGEKTEVITDNLEDLIVEYKDEHGGVFGGIYRDADNGKWGAFRWVTICNYPKEPDDVDQVYIKVQEPCSYWDALKALALDLEEIRIDGVISGISEADYEKVVAEAEKALDASRDDDLMNYYYMRRRQDSEGLEEVE